MKNQKKNTILILAGLGIAGAVFYTPVSSTYILGLIGFLVIPPIILLALFIFREKLASTVESN